VSYKTEPCPLGAVERFVITHRVYIFSIINLSLGLLLKFAHNDKKIWVKPLDGQSIMLYFSL